MEDLYSTEPYDAEYVMCRGWQATKLITVEVVFYVSLFYVKPVFYLSLSRTKSTLCMVFKLYFVGSSHLSEENWVSWGHVKYTFPCTCNSCFVI